MEAFCKKRYFAEAISLLYVALFVYAASSKFMDFENFQVQLGQSPLLSAFAGYISWLVPLTEFAICALLLLPRTRFIGLLSSYTLMVMFTIYIVIVLNFTSFIPCSCGGILEKLGWTEHLIFNFIFIILAVAAIICYPSTKKKINTLQFKAFRCNLFFLCQPFQYRLSYRIISAIGKHYTLPQSPYTALSTYPC